MHHPANVYPVFVYLLALKFDGTSYVHTCASIEPIPMFELKLILYVFAVHCAYKFTIPFAVCVKFSTSCPLLYDVPVPSCFVFQFLNVYPILVYLFSDSLAVVLYSNFEFSIVPVVVSVGAFWLYITVYLFFVQIAYRVIVPFGVVTKFDTSALSLYNFICVEPVASLASISFAS